MARGKRYRVVDDRHPLHGKVIKPILTPAGQYLDKKTNIILEESQLQELSERHAVYGNLVFGRFCIGLFAREYIKYHSYQFGIGFDFYGGFDKYFDIEVKVACFGLGIRFTWIKKH